MALDANKGYRALRRGRWSASNAEYFLTFCTAGRKRGLDSPAASSALSTEWGMTENDGCWTVRCAVIMPDHVHLLIVLGHKLPLGRCVARLKSRTTPTLRLTALEWQSGYFDRRLRREENLLPYFLYLYLNPYRAGLVDMNSRWPGFFCRFEDFAWFSPLLNAGLPEPAWLADLP